MWRNYLKTALRNLWKNKFYSFINIFILLLACINFMNLSTARSAGRAREVGMRKVVGAQRRQLMAQFLSESVLISILALFVAVGLVFLLLPYFNDLSGKAFSIACLGLFGLATYTAEQRTKEIGIRKVLGAPVGQLFLLMTSDFARWVLLASLIALPLAYYGMSRWLQGFEYRAGIGAGSLTLAVALVLFIAFLTVSYQALRVARIDPVKTLKYE